MEYQKQIQEYFAAHRQQLVDAVCRLVRIRSVGEDPQPGMPYGPGPAAALAEALEMAGQMGFATRNYENYVGTADLNDHPTQLAILAHLDVVHEGTGWTVTEPYEPVEKEGKLYGRGTGDDKGPAVAALFAMKAVKELGIPLQKNVRLILGTDEERGSHDLTYYFSKEKAPPMSFSPDANYPVINIEKGGLRSSFTGQWQPSEALPRLVRLEGGNTANIVPQQAFALLEGIDLETVRKHCDAYQAKTRAQFQVSQENGLVRIDVLGLSAHASMPEKGNNAIQALVEAVSTLPLAKSSSFDHLQAVARLFPHGDYLGRALGVDQKDDISGVLTLNLGIFHMDLEHLEGVIDSRTPICANEMNMSRVVARRLAEYDLQLENTRMNPPHHTPADSPLVKTLLSIYENYTSRQGGCIAIGGGTYVHHIEGGVAFGCAFPETDNHFHGPDEFAVVDDLLISAQMFAQAIVELCA
ncbi:MAG TPA: Sapep family Mn(2+)-dependent dipeptidase [Firmicutes bacterium]|nr:Sapep family Mn(2+)-dependent dipeptidase [Bacillota bacterium]